MRFTESFKEIAKRGDLDLIQQLYFEMPPLPTYSWSANFLSPNLTDTNQVYAAITHNIDFIVELIKMNQFETAEMLIRLETAFQSEDNVGLFLDVLNLGLNGLEGHVQGYSLSKWAIEHAPSMLNLGIVQQDLYETHVKEMVQQALRDNDPEALENLLAKHAARMPDQLTPSFMENIKDYIPTWVKAWISPELSYVLGNRARSSIFSYMDDATISPECKRILAPYNLESKLLQMGNPQIAPPVNARSIADDIYKYKLTDNPRVMRTLQIAQLIEAAQKGSRREFLNKLEGAKDILDLTNVYQIMNVLLPNAQSATPNDEHVAKINRDLAEELLQATHHLYDDAPHGLTGIWDNLAQQGYSELLKIPGVMPNQISIPTLKHLIKTNAQAGRTDMLDLLAPYAKQHSVSLLFDPSDIQIETLSKEKASEVVSRLNDITSGKRRAESVVPYHKSKASESRSASVSEKDADAELKRGGPRKT